MGSLTGRIALVTGGGRGIGKAISLALATEGATIAINYRRDKESAEETMREILDNGGLATIHQGSNDIPEENVAMVKDILSVHDGIDIAVLNGGIASKGRSVLDTEAEELWQLVATHALGPHQLCRALLPSMRTRDRGDIVFISSVATTGMSANGAPYNMGKAAMEALALTLAKEERPHNIRVNIVAPGLVETDMGVRLARAMTGRREMEDLRSMDESAPFGRICQPEDIANAVLWFCSPSASYITGQRMQVDGGGSNIRVGQ
ncbi:MAG: SDR family NAD(P)-dependent oxidoreductase [Ilumatobacteraceae bacterium]|jgi:NAD(P)-dependent dehydrogenase (short-subunit alcohol dehydrogenase family)